MHALAPRPHAGGTVCRRCQRQGRHLATPAGGGGRQLGSGELATRGRGVPAVIQGAAHGSGGQDETGRARGRHAVAGRGPAALGAEARIDGHARHAGRTARGQGGTGRGQRGRPTHTMTQTPPAGTLCGNGGQWAPGAPPHALQSAADMPTNSFAAQRGTGRAGPACAPQKRLACQKRKTSGHPRVRLRPGGGLPAGRQPANARNMVTVSQQGERGRHTHSGSAACLATEWPGDRNSTAHSETEGFPASLPEAEDVGSPAWHGAREYEARRGRGAAHSTQTGQAQGRQEEDGIRRHQVGRPGGGPPTRGRQETGPTCTTPAQGVTRNQTGARGGRWANQRRMRLGSPLPDAGTTPSHTPQRSRLTSTRLDH